MASWIRCDGGKSSIDFLPRGHGIIVCSGKMETCALRREKGGRINKNLEVDMQKILKKPDKT